MIAESFADIFRQNALKNGLLPIVLGPADHGEVLARVGERPGALVRVDLEQQLVRVPGDHFTANSRPELHRALTEFLAEQ